MAMAKAKKRLSKALAAVFTAFTLLSMAPAAFAAGPINANAPTVKGGANLQINAQTKAEYKIGERIDFYVQAPNVAGLVEYRVAVWNKETGMRDLFQDKASKAKGYWYQPWKTAGTYERRITWIASGDNWPQGDYQLVAYVRRNGQKTFEDYETVGRFKLVKDAPVAEATIASLANPADATVNEGAAFTAPTTVKATLSDNTTKDVAVAWDKTVDTKVAGDVTLTGKVEGTDKTVSMKVSVKAVALQVQSVAAVKANTLKVTFNKAVDTAKAVLTVKKDTTTMSMNAAVWNDAKTEATLVKTAGSFTEGDYTVTVSGLENIDAANASKTVAIKDQKVSKIEFVTNDLVKNKDEDKATFRYIVKDQYGEDMTKNATNLQPSTSLGSKATDVDLDETKGIGTIEYGFKADLISTKVVVTLADPETGVTGYATLDITSSAKVTDFSFGEVKYPKTDYKRLQIGRAEAGYIPVVAKDQFGNTLDLDTLKASMMDPMTSTSDVVATWDEDENDKPILKLDTTKLTDAKTIMVTLVSRADGKPYSKTLEIFKAAEPKVVKLGDFNKATIASGDEGIAMSITVLDQFGNEMDKDDIADNASKVLDLVSFSSDYFTNVAVETDENDDNYGKIVFDAKKDGTTIISATSVTAGVTTKTVKIKEARKLTEVVAPSRLYLIQGASKDVEFKFLDQYDEEMDLADTDYVLSDVSYKATLEKVSGENDSVLYKDAAAPAFQYADNNGKVVADETNVAAIPVKAATNVTGVYKLTVDLINKDSKTISTASVLLETVKNNVSGLAYSITAIPAVPGEKDSAYDETSQNARKVTVTAKDSSGNSYVINSADVVSVVSSDTKVADVAKDADGKWRVFGVAVSDNSTADRKATITARVNTLDGIKIVTTEVTVTAKAPVVKELKVINDSIKNLDSADGDKTPEAWIQDALLDTAKNHLTFADFDTTSETGTDIFVVAKDQYGVWYDLSSATIFVNSTDLADRDAFSIAGGKLIAKDGATITLKKDIKATIMVGDAVVQIIINATK
jgi:trimeric autotransporter adhesin